MRWGWAMVSALVASGAQARVLNVADAFAGRWDSLESYASLNQCSLAPAFAELYFCSPAQLGGLKRAHFESRNFVVATESMLKLADELKGKKIDGEVIDGLFKKYNYSDALISTRIGFARDGLLVGVMPIVAQAQFIIQNPSLPFGSLTFRQDLGFFAGYGRRFELGTDWTLSAGAIGTFLKRSEILAEATVVELLADTSGDLTEKHSKTGFFVDAGLQISHDDEFMVGVQAWDLGAFTSGADETDWLYVIPDRSARLGVSAAWAPRVGLGRLQLGAGLGLNLALDNNLPQQWSGSVSYYIGPFRFLSAFRPGLLRTGLSFRFSTFETVVAQEWFNELESGRKAQPRFTVGVTAGL